MDDTFKPLSGQPGQQGVTISASQLEQIGQLCDFMQMLRAWWEHFERVVRQLDWTAAAKAHDLIVEGVVTARALARQLGIALPDTADLNWSASVRQASPAGEL